ncbi:MAG TPA: pilus assembly protein TadE [Rhodobacteraceae bacterium]|nr:pilus assembly protein TadE [Paracoccaceae bacterium]
MTRALRSRLWRFRRDEDGNSTIEFALTFPAVMVLFLSAIELGYVTLQHGMLERAMDMTVRDIRLGTGTAPQHDDIKDLICTRAGFIRNCSDNLRLEMVRVDPRAWNAPPETPDCTDQSEDVKPVRDFVQGRSNELMFLRACAKIDPIFPTTGLGASMTKDGAGQFALVSNSAFVQEPQ